MTTDHGEVRIEIVPIDDGRQIGLGSGSPSCWRIGGLTFATR